MKINLKTLVNLASSGPLWVGDLLANINHFPGIIFGRQYLNNYHGAKGNGADDIDPLIEAINNAIKTVPYYQKLYSGLLLKNKEEFSRLIGFIDKNIVVDNFNDFLSTDFNESDYDLVTTGGTTGAPMKLFVPKDRYKMELATVHSAWGRVGYNFSKRAVLRNHKITGRPYIINPITKEYIFDGFNLSDENFMLLYNVMKKKNLHYLHAYTSNAFEFAKFLVLNNLDTGFIKGFLTASENVYPHQHDYITKVAKIRHFNIYGHSEKLAFAAYCLNSDIYHFDNNYGYVELIDDSGQKVSTPGAIGEIVASTLSNRGMPLIRYKTGDYAEYAFDVCPHCGHEGLSVRKILGRWGGERIYNTDGSYVTTTALNLHDSIYEKISGLQYHQPEKGVLNVRVIPRYNFDSEVARDLKNSISSKLSSDTVINIIESERIEKSKNGKLLLLISGVK